MKVQPYLFFNGRCEEAIDFYKKALGAEVLMLMRFRENPDTPPPGMVPPGSEDKVMHACLRIGETEVMASDGMCSGNAAFAGVSLSLEVPNEAEADRCSTLSARAGRCRCRSARPSSRRASASSPIASASRGWSSRRRRRRPAQRRERIDHQPLERSMRT
jgi:PhnB protein